MDFSQSFSIGRYGRLLINDLYMNARGMLVTAGAILGVLLVVNVASVASAGQWQFHDVFFPLTLLVGGHVATSLAFAGLHNKTLGYRYLTLPGSIFEKFSVKLLLTAVGWPVLALLAYQAFSLLAAGLTSLLFQRAHAIFDPSAEAVWTAIRLYVVTQAVTLFGAVRFRRLALIKTSLVAAALTLALMIIGIILARLVFGPYFRELGGAQAVSGAVSWDVVGGTGRLLRLVNTSGKALWIAFWWLMAPFFWTATFFRLAETELR
jgi:hypothetical protein